MTTNPTPADVLKAVLDPLRLAVLGSSASGSVSIGEIADRMQVQPRDVAEAVGHLRSIGLLDADGALVTSALHEIGRELPKEHEGLGMPVEGPWTEEESIILGRFFDGDILVAIPQAAAKRRLVLEKIALTFEPGTRYAERDVNFRIQLIHPDYAAVRRYLVEEGFMDRADGAYWRIGGRYEPPKDAQADDEQILRTEREDVVLRPYRSSMVPALVLAADDARIPRFMGDQFPYPYTTRDAENWVAMASRNDPPTQYALFVDDVLAGGLGGFADDAERTGSYEIGWWLNPTFWGQGITTAAVRSLVDEFFGERGAMRLWAPVMAPNEASARVAEKAGLRFEGVAPGAYLKGGVRHDQRNFGVTRPQWIAARSR